MPELEDSPQTQSVRSLLEEELQAEELHGLTVTRRQGETVYCVVSRSTTWDRVQDGVEHDLPVLDLRTVVVDLEQETVSATANGLWVPQEQEVASTLTQLLGRTTTDLGGGTAEDAPPALHSAVEGLDPALLLERELEVQEAVEGQHQDKMENHGGIDPARSWGYGGGPPPEVHDLVERLEEAGLQPAEHLTRLVWGKKEPMDRKPRPVEELTGNYGLELLPREEGLIAIDVDYPEEFPEDVELPETLEVSSPHGDDTQRHILLRCDSKRELAEEIGAWAVQGVSWGDLWVGDRYLVGPGSQLSEFGCDDGEHQRGERGGCEACSDPERGYYRVVSDAPIATVEPEQILQLLEDSEGFTLRDGKADADPPEPQEEDAAEQSTAPSCDYCGAERSQEELKLLEVGGDTRAVCRGGCDA